MSCDPLVLCVSIAGKSEVGTDHGRLVMTVQFLHQIDGLQFGECVCVCVVGVVL